MCGICGIIHSNDQTVEPSQLRRMAQTLEHRGPDHQGEWSQGRAGLAHRRLSIIDLSASGNQPMLSDDASVALVFNGEIYNFQALRKTLEAEGAVFRSNTDSEVIIKLYQKKGIDCVHDLRGMFSFAIWDDKRQQLFAARDRIGKKPFKYYFDGQRFAFASELKALLTLPYVSREVDPLAVHYHLNFGYVPPPHTGFKSIHKLPAAHYLVWKNGDIQIERYWRLSYQEKEERSEAEWADAIIEKLDEAVRLRLVSDVPLGIFLSGGLDSSAIAALAAKNSEQRIKTFSIGFSVQKYNELPQARLVAEQVNAEHHEFVVEPDNLIETFQYLVGQYEEPYSDSSALPSYYLARMAKDYVTVALNGDGGDENFAGYERYSLFEHYLNKRTTLSRLGAGLFAPLVPEGLFPHALRRKIQAGKALFRDDLLPFYIKLIGFFDSDRFLPIYGDQFRDQIGSVDPLDWMRPFFHSPHAGNVPLEQAMYTDFHSYLPEDLMTKVDIATMTHSMEGRSPLLDHEFMELTARIPASLKLKNGSKKYIFKKAIENLIPKELLHLPKMGFGIPIHEWFLGELKDWAKDYLLGDRFIQRGYIKREAMERLWRDHEARQNQGYYIWLLLTLEEWHRQYID